MAGGLVGDGGVGGLNLMLCVMSLFVLLHHTQTYQVIKHVLLTN